MGCEFDPQPLSELPWRSLGMSAHLNRPGKKHNSGFGLPPIAVTKVNKKKTVIDFSNWQPTKLQKSLKGWFVKYMQKQSLTRVM